MPVFKLCLQIYKKNINTMMIYFGVFFILSLLVTSFNKDSGQMTFNQSKAKMAFISKDKSPLINGLKKSLEQVATIIDIPDEQISIQDALYYREVAYVLRVPENYSEMFMRGEEKLLEKITLPNSVDAIYINIQVDQYLKLAKLYLSSGEKNISTLTQNVNKDMSINTTVEIENSLGEVIDQNSEKYYFNFMAYSLFSVLILGISTVLLVFNNINIQRRNSCSPMNVNNMNFQFLLANITFSVICWSLYVILCFIINFKNIQTYNTLLFMFNSFIFTICAGSISFFIGTLIKNREAISALANVVALGSSFISGVFVPQEILSESVLKIASFTPTYWYVRGNNLIGSMTNITNTNFNILLGYIAVQLGFALTFIALALVVGKQKQQNAES